MIANTTVKPKIDLKLNTVLNFIPCVKRTKILIDPGVIAKKQFFFVIVKKVACEDNTPPMMKFTSRGPQWTLANLQMRKV